MNRKISFLCLIISTVMMLSGCGQIIPDLTEEESDKIALYAATVLMEHDTKHKKTLLTEEEVAQEEEKMAERARNKAEREAREAQSKEGSVQEPTPVYSDINEIILLDGIQISYDSYEVCESYPDQDSEELVFTLDAAEGQKLLVVKFCLTNQSDSVVEANVFDKNPTFSLVLNGGSKKKSLSNMLLDDFAFFKQEMEAGEEDIAVVVFSYPEEELNTVTSMSLKVSCGDRKGDIMLQ